MKRRSPEAKSLADTKYRQRVIVPKKRKVKAKILAKEAKDPIDIS